MTERAGGRMAGAGGRLTEAQFRDLYERLRARPEWGPRDRRGALNFLTPDVVAAACREVRLGRSVSLAGPVEDRAAPDNPQPASHHMNTGQDVPPGAAGLAFAADRFAMNIHGDADSHLDALCHVIFDGHLYNGVQADVITADGARALSVAADADGIVGRGVLLDIPRLRGLPWLEPGEHVTADDLASAEASQRVRVGRGDLLFVRVGHRRRKAELGAWDAAASRAGLHPSALEFVAEREVAVLGSDSNSDTAPSVADGVDFPVHVLAINALGVQLLDYLQFEDLVPLCEAVDHWTFLCVVAPLRIPGGTGSPVNPIAVV
ncbi:MAG TPA: cyclase family protein [Streptosporangiaceae bacterium]